MKLFLLAILGTLGLCAQSNAPIIVAKDGTYLGRLSNDPYAADSISNPYGKYGSPYSGTSINNPYGKYGSSTSSYSPWGGSYVPSAPVFAPAPVHTMQNFDFLLGREYIQRTAPRR